MRRARPPISPGAVRPILIDPVPDLDVDIGGPGDLLERVLARRFPPDLSLQISPALSDLTALGVADPSATIASFFDELALEVGGAMLVLDEDVGDPPEIPAGASPLEIAVAIIRAGRSTRFGVWFGAPPAPEIQLRLAVRGTDLETAGRLVADVSQPKAPFAVRLRYEGIERAVAARFAGTGGVMSLRFEPCACGPLRLDDVRVAQLRIGVSGGGINDGRPPVSTVPTDAVSTTLSISLIADEVLMRADVIVDESVATVRRATGSVSPDRYEVLAATSKVRLNLTSIDTRGGFGDLVDRLEEGGLGERLLGALLGPFARVREEAVEGLVDWAERRGQDELPPTEEGVLVELAEQLGAPILLPAANGVTEKLLFEADRFEVGDDRLDFRGDAFVLPREPRVRIVARGLGGRVTLTAAPTDLREPRFTWSSPIGVFEGPTDEPTARISFPSSFGGVVRVDVVDADGLTAVAEGAVAEGLGVVVPLPAG